jgi:hypothetical protein
MVNKTRKLKKQKGGAKPHLPRNIAPIERAPGQTEKQLIDQFFTRNNLYLISAHGNLSSTKTYKVPPDTYILHFAPSGIVCINDEAIRELLSKKGNLDNPEVQKKQLWKFLTGQKQNDLYRDLLYDPDKPGKQDTSIAFYEPGDIVSDMNFYFENESLEMAVSLCGAYNVPVADHLFGLSEEISEEQHKKLNDVLRKEGAVGVAEKSDKVKAALKKAADSFFEPHNKKFYDSKENLLGNYLKTAKSKKMTEEQIVRERGEFIVPEGGIRIFLVFSCRAPDVDSSNVAKSLRRKSLSLRSYTPKNVTIEEKNIEENEKRREEIKKKFKDEVREKRQEELRKILRERMIQEQETARKTLIARSQKRLTDRITTLVRGLNENSATRKRRKLEFKLERLMKQLSEGTTTPAEVTAQVRNFEKEFK